MSLTRRNCQCRFRSLRIDGAEGLAVDRDGDLAIRTASGRLLERAPRIVGGGAAGLVVYRILGPREVGLRFARGPLRQAVWIDPELSFSSFLGGQLDDYATGVAQDESGNVYVAGVTHSADFPTKNPFQRAFSGVAKLEPHAFVSKIDPRSGTLLYSTYLGGSSTDFGSAIAVDAAGNMVVAGRTSSTDFPIRAAFQPRPRPPKLTPLVGTGFVAKLDPTGSSLVFSTYLGSSQEGWGFESSHPHQVSPSREYTYGRRRPERRPPFLTASRCLRASTALSSVSLPWLPPAPQGRQPGSNPATMSPGGHARGTEDLSHH